MQTIDHWIVGADTALRTLAGAVQAARPLPPLPADAPVLDEQERRLAGALMRVNHVGEVCAQALYQAQALTARTDRLQQRLKELGDRPSLLNPLWYAGAFAIGLAAGRLGDATSLGFVVETEHQVEEHLAGHLDRLPSQDQRSRDIVAAMKADERAHADAAEQAGALPLPLPVKLAMRAAARVMTATAHRL
jgi:ubiquinone biosynthesis monooxygenase Coq7